VLQGGGLLIRFAGHDWEVKANEQSRVGPGPNYFARTGVYVDGEGMHLRAEVRNGRLYCAEVISVESFGFGTYGFEVGAGATRLDSKLVLGLFTWSDDPQYDHREIDMELSRWGLPDNKNAQFVVQPYTTPGNIFRFVIPYGESAFNYTFTWEAEQVMFEATSRSGLLERHVIRHSPPPGGENVRINLWGLGPLAGDGTAEIIVKKFSFTTAENAGE
jgi:hypothetical protein